LNIYEKYISKLVGRRTSCYLRKYPSRLGVKNPRKLIISQSFEYQTLKGQYGLIFVCFKVTFRGYCCGRTCWDGSKNSWHLIATHNQQKNFKFRFKVNKIKKIFSSDFCSTVYLLCCKIYESKMRFHIVSVVAIFQQPFMLTGGLYNCFTIGSLTPASFLPAAPAMELFKNAFY
jgi:hypothetical protein